MTIRLKCTREAPESDDGLRVLVERRRPRVDYPLSAWLPALAPSAELARAKPLRWPLFRRLYFAELCNPKAEAALVELHELAATDEPVTLLTGSAAPELSHAALLRELLEGARKPPASSGPARAAGGVRSQSSRRRH
jgi:uncharacterized protein YeaO (DUF488 family)